MVSLLNVHQNDVSITRTGACMIIYVYSQRLGSFHPEFHHLEFVGVPEAVIDKFDA